ncbi:MAG TPA: ATP-binding protein, partial [Kofleriaceae bacterium]|nr:ATP-binding protein [Kofleriaceae bacterium]
AAVAGASGRALAVIDATMILRDLRRRGDELAIALRRANLAGMLPCVDGLEAIPSDDAATRDELRQLLDEHPGPLALRLPQDSEPPLAPGYFAIDLPALTMEQRTASWRVLLGEHGLDVRDPGELADRYRVGPAVIARACAQVAAVAHNGERADASLQLEHAVRQHLETRLRATATRVERLASWSRVILPPDIQESVLELIARIKHRRTVYEHWGLGEVMTTARGVTALFQGGPGTGKTLVASAIANELGMDLYRVDLSRIMSKWIGETEQNLAKLFDAAEDGHTIVLFDEADSLFAKRTEVKSSVDRYANLEVNYLLQRLDTFEGIAILTTNFGTSIDSAFKRRLSFRLTFPFPDEDAREQLWRSHLPAQLPTSGDFDLAALARRYRLSGGYIRNAAIRAAFLAAEEHSPLTQDHLERAIKAEFREIGKLAETGVLE